MKQSIVEIEDLKTGDVLKSYKIKGMKKYEKEYKSYEAFNDNTHMINIEGFVVERGFNTKIIKSGRYLRLQKNDDNKHFIFPLDTKFKCYQIDNTA